MFDFLKKKNVVDKDGVFILFDIGGTKMRIAMSYDGKNIAGEKAVPTPKNFTEGMDVLKKSVEEIRQGEKVRAISGAVPGIMNRDQRTIFKLPNLPDWDGRPIRAELEKMFQAPVFLENDAALSGLGEATFGSGRGYGIVAFMTVSTGVGGARIVNGKIDRKTYSFEPGWQIINLPDLTKDKDSAYLGYRISGNALKRRFGKNPADISDSAVLDELASWLAVGLYNSILHWSPEVVVLGGPMIVGVNPIPLDKVEAKLMELLFIFPEAPSIKKAVLGDMSGLYGALALAGEKSA